MIQDKFQGASYAMTGVRHGLVQAGEGEADPNQIFNNQTQPGSLKLVLTKHQPLVLWGGISEKTKQES